MSEPMEIQATWIDPKDLAALKAELQNRVIACDSYKERMLELEKIAVEKSTELTAAIAAKDEAEAKLAMVCGIVDLADDLIRRMHDRIVDLQGHPGVAICGHWCIQDYPKEVRDPQVAAFTARLKRQGAAEELRAFAARESWAQNLPLYAKIDVRKWLEARAAELEGE